ncbi:MAG: SpoIIIAH-like family protein [Clostridia bacterium]|nr:SpoIIIAH-like family protein [Clostridia bacterium]
MSRNQKFTFRGKQVLLLGLVALVITAGYYRWTVETEKFDAAVPVTGDALPENAEQTQEGETQNESKTMAQLKTEREKKRGEELEEWAKITKDRDASAEAKSAAEKNITNTNRWMQQENTVETLVKAKGYSDCFAHITEHGISVMVAGGEIDGAKVAQIKDIIVSETKIPVRNIKISAESF